MAPSRSPASSLRSGRSSASVIVDDGQFVFEATGIIEYLEARFPETARLIPSDPALAAEVRMWDRFFDNYVSYPQGRLVFMVIGREPDDGKGGAAWKSMLETSYALLDRRMAGRTWAVGENFSLADCAAAPALLYADWSAFSPDGSRIVTASWDTTRAPRRSRSCAAMTATCCPPPSAPTGRCHAEGRG